MSGREIKALYSADWDALLGVFMAYLDYGGIFDSDGRELEDAREADDGRTYRITGMVCAVDPGNNYYLRKVCTLPAMVRKWRKAQRG